MEVCNLEVHADLCLLYTTIELVVSFPGSPHVRTYDLWEPIVNLILLWVQRLFAIRSQGRAWEVDHAVRVANVTTLYVVFLPTGSEYSPSPTLAEPHVVFLPTILRGSEYSPAPTLVTACTWTIHSHAHCLGDHANTKFNIVYAWGVAKTYTVLLEFKVPVV